MPTIRMHPTVIAEAFKRIGHAYNKMTYQAIDLRVFFKTLIEPAHGCKKDNRVY